jgi:hypothetical protein
MPASVGKVARTPELSQARDRAGRDLTIRRFSPPDPNVFGLLAADVGGLIGQIRHNLTLACDAAV